MSLGNTALWGDVLPGGVAGETTEGGIDTTEVIDELLPSLHAASRADLTFWSEGDLIEWLDQALQRLASKAAVFVGRQATTLTAPGQATYDRPDRHISTLHVSVDGVALRPAATRELGVRDKAFRTAQGVSTHWYEDLLGTPRTALAKVPNAELPLAVIYEGWPESLDAGKQQTIVAAPAPLKGYLAMCVLEEAYSREGEAEMADVAEHCRGRVALYDALLQAYYGRGL